MTNDRPAAEWTFDVFMEMRFSGKKTWFVRATNNDTNVYWVKKDGYDEPLSARELATSLQVKHGHQAAYSPMFQGREWDRRGVLPVFPG